MLNLDKVKLTIEECALRGRFVGSNPEHLQVLLAKSEFLTIIIMEDFITKLAFT